VAKTRQKAQLRGQNLPAKSKNNKTKARDLSAYIVDWADLSAEQRKELDSTSWGPRAPDSDEDEDINEPDSDESMSGNPAAGGSGGGAPGGGGGPPGGGGGGGGGGGIPPVVPAPLPTLDDLTRLVADIGNAIGLLAQQVTLLAARPGGRSGNRDVIPKPKAWDGKGGSVEARHFLAAFNNYAQAQGDPLNTFNQPTNTWIINQTSWIQSALNLMEGDARTWALPHLEELQHGRDPFGGIWQTFVDQFSRRFAPLDTAESAREALKKIRQGKVSVPEYMAQFDQHTGQTGWSDADHRQRFYDGLAEFVKDGLALTDRPIGTFDEVRAAAQVIDQRYRQRQAEKKGHTTSHTPFGASSDPNAMQVDATRTGSTGNNNSNGPKKDRAAYMKHMQGKCYGCGSTQHTKKDGGHERDVCNHCGKVGHRSTVCFAKYVGKPGKSASAKATTDGTVSTSSTSSQPAATAAASSSSKPSPAKDNKTQADLLAQLMVKIQEQDKQIKALKASF
jgi:hypothetical protein